LHTGRRNTERPGATKETEGGQTIKVIFGTQVGVGRRREKKAEHCRENKGQRRNKRSRHQFVVYFENGSGTNEEVAMSKKSGKQKQ